jgi:ABC-type transport system substrate-binding protein
VFENAKEAGLFGKPDTFRENGKDILATGKNVQAGRDLLTAAGVDATRFMFAISVPAYDDVQLAIAEEVKNAWTELGFHVAINAIGVIENTDKDKTTDAAIKGVMDDLYQQNYRNGAYDVAAVDTVAISVDPFSVLAPYAQNYTGRASGGNTEHESPVHITGYKNDAYTKLIDEAFHAADPAVRSQKLHEAEELLMADLPVIPIVYNQNVNLASDELSKYEITYYGTPVFTKLVLKDYLLYVPAKEEE